MPSRSRQSTIEGEDLLTRPLNAYRGSGSAIDLQNDSGRLVTFKLSDSSVGRDNHIILPRAWQYKNFLRNPVMPWAHDTSQPPIAKWVDISERGDDLFGTAEYADTETYPFADTIFRLVKGGFLNAVSTGWIPLEWKFSSDRARPGGIDFSKVELLEVSQVPVPALPTALVTARAQGIDTGPLYQWAERMLDTSELAVLPRSELELLRKEAKMPKAARAKVEAPLVPEVIPEAPAKPKLGKRSLSHVGWLAMLLADLGWVQESVAWEAAMEEDGSTVPAEMLEAMKALGTVLIAMTIEEVNELLAGDDEDDVIGDVVEMASAVEQKRAAFRALRCLDAGSLVVVTMAMRKRIAGETVSLAPLIRAGKVLSAENERCLRAAHDHMTQAVDMVRSVVDKNGDDSENDDDNNEDDNQDDDDEKARALRVRKARALKRRVSVQAA